MIDQIRKYFYYLYKYIPTEVFDGLLIAFLVGWQGVIGISKLIPQNFQFH